MLKNIEFAWICKLQELNAVPTVRTVTNFSKKPL